MVMKIDNSGKKFTYIAALIITLFGAISAAFVWQLTDREELINEPPSGRTVTTAPTQPETATPTPVMFRLPNADAVPALVDDYANDASLWKLVNITCAAASTTASSNRDENHVSTFESFSNSIARLICSSLTNSRVCAGT
jgi:hypothetical protein